MNNQSNIQENLPDFLIAGAAKSGTTSLYFYLNQHPDIFFPSIKEPRFFVCVDEKERPKIKDFKIAESICDFAQYISLFEGATNNQLKGEASTDYLNTYEVAINNIYKYYGEKAVDLPIILILRNPIERAWSHYTMQRRDGKEPLPFLEACRQSVYDDRVREGWPVSFDYLGYGRYSEQVKSYQNAFKNVYINTFDKFVQSPMNIVSDLFNFLGVDSGYPIDTQARYNVSGKPTGTIQSFFSKVIYKPNFLKSLAFIITSKNFRYYVKTSMSPYLFKKEDMPTDIKNYLLEYYFEDIEILQENIGINLEHWKS